MPTACGAGDVLIAFYFPLTLPPPPVANLVDVLDHLVNLQGICVCHVAP